MAARFHLADLFETVARTVPDRVAVIADKRVIAVGTIPELIATDHPWITSYFNGPRGRAAMAANERNAALGTAGQEA